MKKIDKNTYKEAQYNRTHLMIFAIIALVLSLAALGGGISMIVVGTLSGIISKIIWMTIVGIILIILGIVFGTFSIIMLFTSFGMIKNKEGSVKDGNRAIGTININKCDKCGEELPDNAAFCFKCGTPVEGTKLCECGTTNTLNAEYCIGCGKKLK